MDCRTLLFAGLVAGFASPAAADVVGRHLVDGQNPDGSRYEGTVVVERTGETFRVNWAIAGTRFTGTAVGNDDVLSITYRSGNSTGVALAVREGNIYNLVWTVAGARQVGTERWSRR